VLGTRTHSRFGCLSQGGLSLFLFTVVAGFPSPPHGSCSFRPPVGLHSGDSFYLLPYQTLLFCLSIPSLRIEVWGIEDATSEYGNIKEIEVLVRRMLLPPRENRKRDANEGYRPQTHLLSFQPFSLTLAPLSLLLCFSLPLVCTCIPNSFLFFPKFFRFYECWHDQFRVGAGIEKDYKKEFLEE
jgi:hypothetical protein